MKKTKLLTSLAALALVVSLGACEVNVDVGGVDVGGVDVGDVDVGVDVNPNDSSEPDEGGTTDTDTNPGTGEGGDENPSDTDSTPIEPPVTYTYSLEVENGDSLTLNYDEALETQQGVELSIKLVTTPSTGEPDKVDATADNLTFTVSDPTIVTVSGLTVLPLSGGETSITVKWSEHEDATASVGVTVTDVTADNTEAELISNLIASVNQLVEECEDEDGLSVWEALHVVASDVEDDTDYISTTRTYDLGTEEDVAFGVVETYTSNDNYTTTRYYTGEGKYYEKTSGGYGTGDQTGIHSTSKGNTYASIADILGYYLEDYLGAIDDSGTLEEYTSEDGDDPYDGCYRYSLTDDEGGLYYYYIEEDGTFVGFFYDNGEEAYEDGWERVEFTPTTEEAVQTRLATLDYESWPVYDVQLQFTFNLDGTNQTIPEGVTLYYVEGETRTLIETSGGRYVVNPSSLDQGTHTYSIVLVAEGVEETIATGSYDITFDDGGTIKQLTVTLTQAFEDYLGEEEAAPTSWNEYITNEVDRASIAALFGSVEVLDEILPFYIGDTDPDSITVGTSANGDRLIIKYNNEPAGLTEAWIAILLENGWTQGEETHPGYIDTYSFTKDGYTISIEIEWGEFDLYLYPPEEAGDPYDELIAALEAIEPNFNYASEFEYESDYYGADGSETVYGVLANKENVGYCIMSEEGYSTEFYSDGENTYSYDGTTAAKEEVLYGYEVYQGTAEQAFMWDLENIVEEVEVARDTGWIVDDEDTSIAVSDSGIEVYLEGSTYDDFIMLYAYYDDDGTFSSFDYMSGNADGDMRYIHIQNYNVTIDAPDWLELVSTGTTINDVISALAERGTDFDFGTGFYYDSIDYSLSYYYETECTSVVDAGGYYLTSSYNFDGDGETITYTDFFGVYSDTELTWWYSDGDEYGYSLEEDNTYIYRFDDYLYFVDFASLDFDEVLEGLEAIASTELDGDEVIVISDELIYLEAYAADELSFVQLYVTYDEDGQITSFIYQYGTETTGRAVILTSTDSVEQPEWSIAVEP